MSDEPVDQGTVDNADSDDPRIVVLQAVFDRVDSWQESADEPTVRAELDDAIEKSDISLDDDLRRRIVQHILDDASHGDVRELLS